MNDIERPIVAKFGGGSVVDARAMRLVRDIVESDPNRLFIIPSAPGSSNSYPNKITDILEIASTPDGEIRRGITISYEHREAAVEEFSGRFTSIGDELGQIQVDAWVEEAKREIFPGNTQVAPPSRGEWLTGKIIAVETGGTFIDAAEIIRRENGRFVVDKERLARERSLCVIPGFYFRDESGYIRTFERGGSDITGALIARVVNARVYENWTHENGVLAANPKVVRDPKTITELTYEEMRELGIRGASVLQRDTILPLIDTDIPINVRNTFNPTHPGTMIVPRRSIVEGEHVIGVAGDKGYMSFNIQKYGMNEEIGIGARILGCFRSAGISYEHSPSGRDYMSVIVNQEQVRGAERFIFDWLVDEVKPDNIGVQRNLGLMAVVGQGIRDHATRVSRILFSALDDDVSIPVRAFSFGASSISMVVVVDEDRVEDAQRVAYERFITT